MMEMLDTQLRTNKEDHTKKLVEVAGRQPDDEDIIAVNPSLFLNSDGEVVRMFKDY